MQNRRDLMKYAHEMTRDNRGFMGLARPALFAHFLREAWAKAKAGTLPSYAPEAVKARTIGRIRNHIFLIEMQDRIFPADYARIAALRVELQALAA